MILTIEVPSEVQSALEAKAARLGVSVDELLRGVVEDYVRAPQAEPEVEPSAEEKRRAAVRSLRGMLAHLPGTVDDFLRERHEEAEREMQKDTADAAHDHDAARESA